jgi:hypothetical protein
VDLIRFGGQVSYVGPLSGTSSSSLSAVAVESRGALGGVPIVVCRGVGAATARPTVVTTQPPGVVRRRPD